MWPYRPGITVLRWTERGGLLGLTDHQSSSSFRERPWSKEYGGECQSARYPSQTQEHAPVHMHVYILHTPHSQFCLSVYVSSVSLLLFIFCQSSQALSLFFDRCKAQQLSYKINTNRLGLLASTENSNLTELGWGLWGTGRTNNRGERAQGVQKVSQECENPIYCWKLYGSLEPIDSEMTTTSPRAIVPHDDNWEGTDTHLEKSQT